MVPFEHHSPKRGTVMSVFFRSVYTAPETMNLQIHPLVAKNPQQAAKTRKHFFKKGKRYDLSRMPPKRIRFDPFTKVVLMGEYPNESSSTD